MPLRSELTLEVGEIFTEVMDELEGGMTATLLKPSTTTNTFDTVLALTEKWFFEYSEFRQAFRLEIGRDDATLTSAMATATHLKIGSDVYVIRNADTMPPKGTDVTWKILCDRFTERGQYADIY